jgi:hypothetical protein
MRKDRNPVIVEAKVRIGKNSWLIPIRKNPDGTGYFSQVGAPLFINAKAATVEELLDILDNCRIEKRRCHKDERRSRKLR